jgi:hypothetical protein
LPSRSRGRWIGPSARTPIAEAVFWRIAITLTMSAPAATANVIESWKLIPHSAWWAASSVSGVAVAYGRIWSLIPASSYQPFARATKKPVWSVFGVQSRARRTVEGVPANGVADGGADCDGGAGDPGAADAEGEGEGDGDGPQPTTRATAVASAARVLKVFTLTRFRAFVRDEERRPGHEDGVESAGLLPSLV